MNVIREYEVRTRLLFSSQIGTVLLLVIDAGIWLQRPDIVDFQHRPQSVPGPFIQDIYDFVVIGAGSAGSVMAARLSEICHWDVLLLEAGADEPFLSDVPFLYPTLQNSKIDWKFRTEPSDKFCLAMEEQRCHWPRGKVLGGSSTINAMLYVRGNRKDYDTWEKLGNPGWGYEDMLPYFLKLEDMRDTEFQGLPHHSTGGPISVEKFGYASRLRSYLWDGLQELNLTNPYGEINGPVQSGFAYPHGSLRDSLRCSTAKGYLRPASTRKNLHISMDSFVEKILIDEEDNRAYGVQFSKDNRRYYVMVSKEVILSAGALNSPHLLMLSGVGPAKHLQQHGVRVIRNLPGVGRNMQDHIAVGASAYLVKNPDPNGGPLSDGFIQVTNPKTLQDFLFHRNGTMVGLPFCEIIGFLNTKYQDPSEDWPDVEVFVATISDLSDGGLIAKKASGMTDNYYGAVYEKHIFSDSYMLMSMLNRPLSRGTLLLQSNDPRHHILIYPNYFEHSRDLEILIESMKFAERLAKTSAMRKVNATLLDYSDSACSPGQYATEDEFYACLVRHYSQTIYHPCGTAKMGPASDSMAVVDRFLKVHGIHGLRVVDASIFPVITTGNTNVPVIATAEKAADMLKVAYIDDLTSHIGDLQNCETVTFDYLDAIVSGDDRGTV